MINIAKTFSYACIGALFLCAASLPAQADVYVGGGGGSFEFKPGKTLASRRYANVVHQKYDFSCGSAALATLLTYHYDNPVSEMDVLTAMYKDGDQQKIQREGFSLLDMKQYLTSLGYQAEGYREKLDKLTEVGIPAIVLINRRGYLHFVVVKGVNDDKVSVADSAMGTVFYSREEFDKMWNGILFVILDRVPASEVSFNTASAWKPYGIPQFRNMLDTGQLGSVTLSAAYQPGFF